MDNTRGQAMLTRGILLTMKDMRASYLAELQVSLLLLVLALLSIAGVAFAQSGISQVQFAASLTGNKQVPPLSTQTTGSLDAVFVRAGNTVTASYGLQVRNGRNLTAAHLHCGAEGQEGPVVAWLFRSSEPIDHDGGDLEKGIINNSEVVRVTGNALCGRDIKTVYDIQEAARAGRIYANVHSTEYPDGVVRGQVTFVSESGSTQDSDDTSDTTGDDTTQDDSDSGATDDTNATQDDTTSGTDGGEDFDDTAATSTDADETDQTTDASTSTESQSGDAQSGSDEETTDESADRATTSETQSQDATQDTSDEADTTGDTDGQDETAATDSQDEAASFDVPDGLACQVLTSGRPVPASYGAAYDTLSDTGELLLRAECYRDGVAITLGTGANVQYIYDTGYRWLANQWQEFSYDGEQKTGGTWFVGTATKRFAHERSDLSLNNFFVAYICTWVGEPDRWRCGCRESACEESAWQIQAYRAPAEQLQTLPSLFNDSNTQDATAADQRACVRSGCSGELCVPEGTEMASACIYKEEYACYADATCERQTNGECGWTQTAELTMCLEEARSDS